MDRQIYQEKMNGELQEMMSKIDQLEKSVKGETANNTEASKIINDLSTKANNLKTDFNRLKQASNDTWQAVKMDFEKSWVALDSAFKLAEAKLLKSPS